MESPAWLLRGISALPGRLRLVEGRLSFTALGTGSAWGWQLRQLGRQAASPRLGQELASGRPALVFDDDLAQLAIRSPWYWFGGGIIVASSRGSFRLAFGPPVGSDGGDGYCELAKIEPMRMLGARWRSVLRAAQWGRDGNA